MREKVVGLGGILLLISTMTCMSIGEITDEGGFDILILSGLVWLVGLVVFLIGAFGRKETIY